MASDSLTPKVAYTAEAIKAFELLFGASPEWRAIERELVRLRGVEGEFEQARNAIEMTRQDTLRRSLVSARLAPERSAAPTENEVAEAIRTLKLKLEVRKQRIWSKRMVFDAEICEVETLIAALESPREPSAGSLAAEVRATLERAKVPGREYLYCLKPGDIDRMLARETGDGYLVHAARLFHEAYCPNCPDNNCALGNALADHARRALTTGGQS
jgi:hypothetical protein